MKKLLLLSFIIALFSIVIISCKNASDTVTVPVPSFKGAYVLYSSASASGSDYAYYDAAKDTIFNNLYQNSNNGTALSLRPGAIKLLDNKNLLITCGGPENQNGNIYLVNTTNHHSLATKSFGNNPGDYAIGNGKIYVSSRDGAYVTAFDMSLNILNDYIDVGLKPGRMIYTIGRYIVCKDLLTTENSLAVVDGTNNVTKVNFAFTPVSIVNNLHGYFLSGCATKQVYRLDSVTMAKIDSISIQTSDSALGDIINHGQNIMYVVSGKQNVWEINLSSSPLTTRLLIQSPGGIYRINAIAYEELTNTIYIADDQGGPPYPGRLWAFDASNGTFKKYYNLYGRNPVGITFKY